MKTNKQTQEETVENTENKKEINLDSLFENESIQKDYEKIKSQYSDIVNGKEGKGKPQASLNEIVEASEKISNITINSSSQENMTEEQKEKVDKNLKLKFKAYDVLKKIPGINPYSWELNGYIKKAKKIRTGLKTELKKYTKELKGLGKENINSSFYVNVWGMIPESVKNNPKYGSLRDFFDNENGTSDNSKGIKNQHSKCMEDGLHLSDLEDMLITGISEYDGKISEIAEAIDLMNQDESYMKDSNKIRQKNDLIKLRNQYGRERETLQGKREDVQEDIADLYSDANHLKTKSSFYESAILKTRKSLRHLNQTIKALEYQKEEGDMISKMGGVFGELDKAWTMVGDGQIIAVVQGGLMKKAYEQISKKENIVEDYGSNLDQEVRDLRTQDLAKRDEETEMQKDFFKSGGLPY